MFDPKTRKYLTSVANDYTDATIKFHRDNSASITFHQVFQDETKALILDSFKWSVPDALILSFNRKRGKPFDQVTIHFTV